MLGILRSVIGFEVHSLFVEFFDNSEYLLDIDIVPAVWDAVFVCKSVLNKLDQKIPLVFLGKCLCRDAGKVYRGATLGLSYLDR